MRHSALLWYLSPFFHSVTFWFSTRKYWLVASFFTISRYFLFRQILGLHLAILLTRTLCVPNIRKARIGTFATHAQANCQRRKRERPNGNTDSKPMFRCVCVLRWLSVLEQQVFHSLGYKVAMLTIIVTPYLCPGDITRILSETTMQLDITKKTRNPSCKRGKG